MDAVNTLFNHKLLLFFIFRRSGKAMPQKEIISFPVQKSLSLILLINKNWVFRTNFIFDIKSIDLRIPMPMRLRYPPERNIHTSVKSHKYFNPILKLVKPILFLTLKKSTVKRSFAKWIKLFVREHSSKDIWMNLNLFYILILGLLIILVVLYYGYALVIHVVLQLLVNRQLS